MFQKIIRELCRRLSPLTERMGFVLSPVHFYFPIPDTRELVRDHAWDWETKLPGIEWNLPGQLALLADLARYGEEATWPDHSAAMPGEYRADAPTFGYTSALFAWTMMRHFKPARVIEVGCGWSTRLFQQAIARNGEDGKPCIYTGIDPYPPGWLAAPVAPNRLLAQRVQDVDPALFETLESGDILFIDSSHVLNTGSDVQRLYLEILPRLNPGVIVHIHDIQLPDEYPREYALRQRWFWNEQYLLQAFLAFNSGFEVLLAGHFIATRHTSSLLEKFPHYDPAKHGSTGSFWMRRRV